jgi:hypothetical protein
MKKDSKEKKDGRPTVYQKDYARMAYVACSESGMSDVKLAKLFGVCKTTITTWKRTYPDFLSSIKKGKDEYDSENVELSLLKRALGYKFTETTREVVPTSQGLVITRKVTKEVPPDAKAAMDWLCNRNPDRWKKSKHVELSGPGGGPVGVTVDPWEQLMNEVSKDNSDELPNRTQRKIRE